MRDRVSGIGLRSILIGATAILLTIPGVHAQGAAELLSVRHMAGGHPTWAKIGASALSESDIVATVQAARRLDAGGVILFSHDGLTGPSRGTEYLSQVGRAAFIQ